MIKSGKTLSRPRIAWVLLRAFLALMASAAAMGCHDHYGLWGWQLVAEEVNLAREGVHCATIEAPWSPRSSPRAVAHKGFMYLLGGSIQTLTGIEYTRDLWRSEDGATWELVTGSAPWQGEVLLAEVFLDALWVVDADTLWRSTDGAAWEEVPVEVEGEIGGLHLSVWFYSLHNDEGWQIFTMDLNRHVRYLTSDGISWTAESLTGIPDWSFQGIVSTEEGYRLFAYSGMVGYDSAAYMMESADGLAWTNPRAVELDDYCYDSTGGVRAPLSDIKRSEGMYWSLHSSGKPDVRTLDSASLISISVDGITWQSEPIFWYWTYRENAALLLFEGRIWLFGGDSTIHYPYWRHREGLEPFSSAGDAENRYLDYLAYKEQLGYILSGDKANPVNLPLITMNDVWYIPVPGYGRR